MTSDDTTDVIWIASYPKSGNTWINQIIRHVALSQGLYDGKPIDVYDLIQQGGQPEPFRALQRPRTSLLKTHAPFAERGMHAEAFERPFRTVAFIHICRNPLDVLLSYVNFTRIQYANVARRGEHLGRYQDALFRGLLGFDRPVGLEEWQSCNLDTIPRENLDHALGVFSDNDLEISSFAAMAGSWKTHAESWRGAAEALPATTLRYEDCLADPAAITAIAEHFRFDEPAVLEANRVVSEQSSRKRGAGGASGIFFNKMQAYYFTRYFSETAIVEFMTRHQGTLRALGYADLTARYLP